MHRAGVLQHAPVGATEPGVVTQHQCRQGTRAAERLDREQLLAQRIAPGRRAHRRLQAFAGLDRARGADTLSQQPGFVVEALRVDQATRALELDRQAPALTGPHRRAVIPGQAQSLWQPLLTRYCIFQLETHHALAHLRQPADPPLQPQGAAVERHGQTVIQCCLRAEAGPDEAEQQQGQRISAPGQQHQRQRQKRQQQPGRRQLRQQRQTGKACGQREHPCAHGFPIPGLNCHHRAKPACEHRCIIAADFCRDRSCLAVCSNATCPIRR